MNRILTLCLIGACCASATAHAELNDRTKKLLQTQALTKQSEQAKNPKAAADDQAVVRGGSSAATPPPAPSPGRSAAGNVPAVKP
ncbi:hypothetical protein AWB67_02613 [Caballeronia terrestris]|uniref:Uncharacterized protein n=1 Tax=Caballeronia terrestris TaxID=1226301 RepID=A0A158IKR0_9BURK|nr:hypothetical protein [Caballeronia terrestris]SAL57148.1 hypothetical protein AWB67_02613 [Caballeronia terrestris]